MNAETTIDIVEELHIAHEQLVGGLRDTFDAAMEIGRLLTEQKAKLNHGQFLPWLRENADFMSVRTAQRCMRLWQHRPELKCDTVTHLTGALKMLTTPRDQRDDDDVAVEVIESDMSHTASRDPLSAAERATLAECEDVVRRGIVHIPQDAEVVDAEVVDRDHQAGDDDITDTEPAPPTLDDYTETTCDLLQNARLRLERIGGTLGNIQSGATIHGLWTELSCLQDILTPVLRECQRAMQVHDNA